MKSAPQENWENDRDWMLFQYVEGELTAEQAQKLEKQLASDEMLQDELLDWQEAFVKDDEYQTHALEAALLKPQTNIWQYFRTYSWLLLVVLVSPGLYKTDELPTKTLSTEKPHITTATTHNTKTLPASLPTATIQTKQKNAMPLNEVLLPLGQNTIENELKTTLIDSSSLPTIEAVELISGKVPVVQSDSLLEQVVWIHKGNTTQSKTVLLSKKQTRQKFRQVTRMKEKSRQQRQANEFMKGNVPYVVPLNSTNF